MLPTRSTSKLKERVTGLATRYDELGESSAQSFDLAFWLARRKVRAGLFESEKSVAPLKPSA